MWWNDLLCVAAKLCELSFGKSELTETLKLGGNTVLVGSVA